MKEGSPRLFGAAPAMESRQCLCLHVGRVFAQGPGQSVTLAQDLRAELWQQASEAQGYLGDAAPMISEAEAFVRRNAHDCLAPHHEKDYRVLQLFAPAFMTGRTLVVLRISSKGTLELDVLRGTGAITSWGMVVIHKGHMRALPLPGTRIIMLPLDTDVPSPPKKGTLPRLSPPVTNGSLTFTSKVTPLKGRGGTLLPCENGGVRHLMDDEIRRCQGVEDSAYKGLRKARTEDEVMASVVVGPGWQAAGAIIGLLEVDEAAWSRRKDSPKDELELLPHSWQEPMALPTAWQSDERCGGPSSKREDKDLVVPRLLGHSSMALAGSNGRPSSAPPDEQLLIRFVVSAWRGLLKAFDSACTLTLYRAGSDCGRRYKVFTAGTARRSR